MRDLFLAFAYPDESFARSLADGLAGRGLSLGDPLSLWPGMRLLSRLDSGLHDARYAVLVVSGPFLGFSWSAKVLDAVASRREVVSPLHGVGEEAVRPHSRSLAVNAIPSSMTENLVQLVRSSDEANGYHRP
jgi:hypothetical protein